MPPPGYIDTQVFAAATVLAQTIVDVVRVGNRLFGFTTRWLVALSRNSVSAPFFFDFHTSMHPTSHKSFPVVLIDCKHPGFERCEQSGSLGVTRAGK